jgi:hypothetical protein
VEVHHQREHLARWLAAIDTHGHLLPGHGEVESVQTDGDDGTAEVADMVVGPNGIGQDLTEPNRTGQNRMRQM